MCGAGVSELGWRSEAGRAEGGRAGRARTGKEDWAAALGPVRGCAGCLGRAEREKEGSGLGQFSGLGWVLVLGFFLFFSFLLFQINSNHTQI